MAKEVDDLELEFTGEGADGDGGARRDYYVDPKPGLYEAVCVDVIDRGVVKDKWGKTKRKVQFAFQLAETITEKMILAAKKAKGLDQEIAEEDKALIGTRLFVQGKKMNFSLFPGREGTSPSDLYAFLEAWNGTRFPKASKDAPLKFKAADYIGKNAQLMIVRNPSKDDPTVVYSNIAAIMPPEDDAEVLTVDEKYIRVKDREGYTAPATEVADDDSAPAEEAPKAKAKAAKAAAAEVNIPYDED